MKKYIKNLYDAVKLFKLIRNNSEKFKVATGVWQLVDECVETGQPRMAKVELVGISPNPTRLVDFWVCPSPGSPYERIQQVVNQRDSLKYMLEKIIKSPTVNTDMIEEAEILIKLFK